MVNLKLVLLAIFLIIGCAFALAPEGEGNEVYAERSDVAELVDELAFEERAVEEFTNELEERAEDEGTAETFQSASCAAPSKGGRPTNAPGRPTTAPTQKPSTPTSKPSSPTSAPTQKPSTPTSKPSSPTSAPTNRPTSAPTTKPSTSGGTSNVGLCDIVPTSQEPVKILVPLYVYPGSAWDTVVSAASKVKIIAIINPNSGPDSNGPDSSYTTYMNKLKNAGVEMVGYVYTSYAARSINDVKAAIDIYKNKYPGVNGIFFDEASDKAADIPFYTQAYNYVMSKGMAHSILNPGVQPDQGYVSIATNIVIFENAGSSASKGGYASWVKCAPNASQKSGYKYKFSGIAHTASSSAASGIINSFASQGMGLVYVTDGAGGCCTYNTLTSYMAAEATTVASLNGQ